MPGIPAAPPVPQVPPVAPPAMRGAVTVWREGSTVHRGAGGAGATQSGAGGAGAVVAQTRAGVGAGVGTGKGMQVTVTLQLTARREAGVEAAEKGVSEVGAGAEALEVGAEALEAKARTIVLMEFRGGRGSALGTCPTCWPPPAPPSWRGALTQGDLCSKDFIEVAPVQCFGVYTI